MSSNSAPYMSSSNEQFPWKNDFWIDPEWHAFPNTAKEILCESSLVCRSSSRLNSLSVVAAPLQMQTTLWLNPIDGFPALKKQHILPISIL